MNIYFSVYCTLRQAFNPMYNAISLLLAVMYIYTLKIQPTVAFYAQIMNYTISAVAGKILKCFTHFLVTIHRGSWPKSRKSLKGSLQTLDLGPEDRSGPKDPRTGRPEIRGPRVL